MKRQSKEFREFSLKYETLKQSGDSEKFTNSFKDIPGGGFPNIFDARAWKEDLVSYKPERLRYETELQEIADKYGFTEQEIPSLEIGLLTGEPLVLFNSWSRISLKRDDEGRLQIWIRVDGLSRDQILEEVEKVKENHPEAIKENPWKNNREWDNFLRDKRIVKLLSARKTAKEVADTLCEEVSAKTGEDYVIDEGLVRQIKSRWKKKWSRKSP